MSIQPSVKRMVLYKHGVAYLERGGPASGPFELSFRRTEMNDVLKSLAVWVAVGDATLGAIGFEKPEDPQQALAERRLDFDHGGALLGLLGNLRGRTVTLRAHGRAERGEVVGVEREQGAHHATRTVVVLRQAAGALALFDLHAIDGLELHDAKSQADIDYILDRSRAATVGETRLVRVDLRGSASDVRVSYVIPAPTWRVSYRIALGAEGVTVMGFGIVHNPADEDLTDIGLTLTTGQPVSFVIDLYNPKTVERVVVAETARRADAPVRYAAAARVPPPLAAPMAASFRRPEAFDSGSDDLSATGEHDDAVQTFVAGVAAQVAADGADRGEFFEYRVRAPISLRRGGSAMVPLFSATGPSKKERIWRAGSENPAIVLSFENFTGAVLEEGAAVIYDEESYAGEAMVPYSARGVSVRLAFAKDLAIRCHERTSVANVATAVSLRPYASVEEYRAERTVVHVIENDHDEAIDVLFERSRATEQGVTIVGAVPIETTANTQRFLWRAPAKGRAEFTFKEVWRTLTRTRATDLSLARVQAWLASRFLDAAAFAELEQIFKLQESITAAEVGERGWEARKVAVVERIRGLTQQLSVLKDTGPEGELRLRYVGELGEAQSEIARCESSAAQFLAMRDQASAQLNVALGRLGTQPSA